MKMILRTRCGCTREILEANIVMSSLPHDIFVPLPAPASLMERPLDVALEVRRFRFWRQQDELIEYREVSE
jgi:hypothetical protein